jgi:hypothetical protein
MMRTAISPRLAIKIFFIEGLLFYRQRSGGVAAGA